jgi:hypothetical protein
LAGEIVKLTEHDNVSRETVRRRLAENDLKPWRKDMWCIPQVDGEYAAQKARAKMGRAYPEPSTRKLQAKES